MSDFTHLHVHSHFSTLDGFNTPKELFEVAKEKGQTSIAITDHGTLAGHREAQRAAKELGMKPILGLEGYWSETDRFDKRERKDREDGTRVYHHLILLAKNANGYNNLNKISEVAWTEGFFHKPRFDFQTLDEYGDDLIITSACLGGPVASEINDNNNPEKAYERAKMFYDRFGNDFYIELIPDNPAEVNLQLLEIADRLGAPVIATADCHFGKPEYRNLEEALLIAGTNPKINPDFDLKTARSITDIMERFDYTWPDRKISFKELDLYVMDRLDIQWRFEKQGIDRPDLYENTVAIADQIGDYEYFEGLDLLPRPKTDDPHTLLTNKAFAGLKRRGLDTQEYRDRLNFELGVIAKKNFSSYFIIVANMVGWAKSKDIMVGPGRGSAAGSLTCYALGITDVDPIKYGLLFFRFINPERNDFPDIDTDYMDTRRHEVMDYLRKQYKNVGNISTFTYYKEKNAIKDAARVLRIPFSEVNRMLKKVETFDDYIGSTDPMVVQFRQQNPEVIKLADAFRGRIRQTGMHAAGIIVSREPIAQYAPTETHTDPNSQLKERVRTIALDMGEVEQVGMIKLDVLGLKTLSVIRDAVNLIRENSGDEIDVNALDLNDIEVYKSLSAGNTQGIFQAEQPASTKLIVEMGVYNFDELTASNALVRPGAANTIGKDYISRKKGHQQVRYIHDIVRPFTENTLGLVLYQEQLMQICVALGGMSMSEADKVRKIIGKKKDVSEFDAYREKFVSGASGYIGPESAERLWHEFEAHADYSFNASHAVAYSMITYWTAWLKHYYPLEFMTALLRNENSDDKLTDYLFEARRLGIEMKLPHINKSGKTFEIDGNGIRFGLTSIKYISDLTYASLNQIRPVSSAEEMAAAAKQKGNGISTRTVEALDRVGALNFGRSLQEWQRHYLYEYLKLPVFETVNLPAMTLVQLRPLDEFDDSEAFLSVARVRGIKKGKGWSLIDLIDQTGTAGVFHDENTLLEPGNMYVLLIANNRIARFIPVDELGSGQSDVLYKMLTMNDYALDEGQYRVVSFKSRRTKAGKLMADMVLLDNQGDLTPVMVWPKTYHEAFGVCEVGRRVDATLGKTEDGKLFLGKVKQS